jgi:hypothetical protein
MIPKVFHPESQGISPDRHDESARVDKDILSASVMIEDE